MERSKEASGCLLQAGTRAGMSSVGSQFSGAHELEADQFTPQVWEGSGLEAPKRRREWRGEGREKPEGWLKAG